LNKSPAVIHQYLEAINDNGAAEGVELVIDRHSNAMLRPLFSLLLWAPVNSAIVQCV